MFAYIDAEDCHGTLFELGAAWRLRKEIVVIFATEELRKKMWFIKLAGESGCRDIPNVCGRDGLKAELERHLDRTHPLPVPVKFEFEKPVSYSDLLKSFRWRIKRQEILRRDNFRCVKCGTGRNLCVHHKRYQGLPWEVADEFLQTLCKDCHDALGKHPKGGIWWTADGGYSYSHCPMCGSEETRSKGSYDKCNHCGHAIVPGSWPEVEAMA